MTRILTPLREAAYRLSLREWLLLLILAGALPAIGLAIYAMHEQRDVMEASQREEMLVLSKFGAALQYDVMQDAHDFLSTLAREKFVEEGDWSGCGKTVKVHLHSHAPWYVNINVALPGGEIVCNTGMEEPAASFANNLSFLEVVKTKSFAVGNHQISQDTGEPALWFHFPVLSGDGKVKAVISSSLDLRALNSVMEKMKLPLGAVMLVLDRSGAVLAHSNVDNKEWLREPPAKDLLVKDIVKRGEGAVAVPDVDGVPRLWGVARAWGDGEQGIYAAVGLPMGSGYADATHIYERQLVGLVLVTLALIALMLLNTKYLLFDRLRTILGLAERLRSGDLSARTGMEGGRYELAQVGVALDEMAAQLEERDAEMRRLLEDTYMKSIRDPLTGLYNRAYLNESLRQLLARAQRHPRPVAMIMVDIDHFKHINDTFGHPAGDTVICAVAQVIAQHIREGDIGCRYGGEEFLIILLEATPHSVRQKADELLEGVRSQVLEHDGVALGAVTISLGTASNLVCGESERDCAHMMEKLIHAADAALYEAKRGGRNRVVESPLNAWPEVAAPVTAGRLAAR